MLFREHKGSLAEAMKSVMEVKLLDDIYNILGLDKISIKKSDLSIEVYGYDHRTNWHTHIVTAKNYGVLGFTNGLLK